MSTFPLPLHENESLLQTDNNAARVKNNVLAIAYNLIFGTLWLTNHRLVFQSSILGSLVSYPLSRIRNARRADVSISHRQSRYSFQNYDAALYIEFDNGGKEYFIPQKIEDWAAAVSDAKADAPQLPFTEAPPRRSAVEQSGRGIGVIATIMAGIVILFLCTAAACIGGPFLLSLFD